MQKLQKLDFCVILYNKLKMECNCTVKKKKTSNYYHIIWKKSTSFNNKLINYKNYKRLINDKITNDQVSIFTYNIKTEPYPFIDLKVSQIKLVNEKSISKTYYFYNKFIFSELAPHINWRVYTVQKEEAII